MKNICVESTLLKDLRIIPSDAMTAELLNVQGVAPTPLHAILSHDYFN